MVTNIGLDHYKQVQKELKRIKEAYPHIVHISSTYVHVKFDYFKKHYHENKWKVCHALSKNYHVSVNVEGVEIVAVATQKEYEELNRNENIHVYR